MSEQSKTLTVDVGRVVYDDEGNELGTVRGFDDRGFYVTANEDVTVLEDEPTGHTRGDAIMWRCWECGEMGQIEDIPEECPSCGASKEEIYYWQED
jgi:ABC-type ATPase with predicted acetyltransferase domain